jgi:hypothetical protein
MELDHIFLTNNYPEEGMRLFQNLGFRLGGSRRHTGQGTSGHFFYFENAYIELLSISAENELQSENVKELNLFERISWKKSGSCPIGIAFRPTNMASSTEKVESWNYQASYLPYGASIPIVTPRNSNKEPLVFISPTSKPPSDRFSSSLEKQEHLNQFKEMKVEEIVIPTHVNLSKETGQVLQMNSIKLVSGRDYLVKIKIIGEIAEDKIENFWPHLPIEVSY